MITQRGRIMIGSPIAATRIAAVPGGNLIGGLLVRDALSGSR